MDNGIGSAAAAIGDAAGKLLSSALDLFGGASHPPTQAERQENAEAMAEQEQYRQERLARFRELMDESERQERDREQEQEREKDRSRGREREHRRD